MKLIQWLPQYIVSCLYFGSMVKESQDKGWAFWYSVTLLFPSFYNRNLYSELEIEIQVYRLYMKSLNGKRDRPIHHFTVLSKYISNWACCKK